MSNWKNTLVGPGASIREAIQAIDRGVMQIALVADENLHLLGTVTDGDVRRGLLRGVSLDESVQLVMQRSPSVAREDSSRDAILDLMRQRRIHQIPVVNAAGQVVGLEVLEELLVPLEQPGHVLLMAGGLGTRLAPLTDDRPKPLLDVGGKPVLETIIEGLKAHGFHKVYLSVNYKAEMIMDHFGNGAAHGVSIEYLRESRPLGTAGALGLLPPQTHPILVMNADLLTTMNFRHLLEFHVEQGVAATVCVREFKLQVPYGVVRLEGQRVLEIEEKPVQKFLVSSGVYVLAPSVVAEVAPDTFLNMPDLFQRLAASGVATAAFPIREYWLDIGRMEDFQRARGEYPEVFQ